MKVVLGSGALGKVLLAEHLPSGSQHVITMLNKPDPFRKIIVERVNDERKILSTLDHPFIIEQYCTSQDDRQLYIVAEWARGGDPFTNLDKLEVGGEKVMNYSNDLPPRHFQNTVPRVTPRNWCL